MDHDGVLGRGVAQAGQLPAEGGTDVIGRSERAGDREVAGLVFRALKGKPHHVQVLTASPIVDADRTIGPVHRRLGTSALVVKASMESCVSRIRPCPTALTSLNYPAR